MILIIRAVSRNVTGRSILINSIATHSISTNHIINEHGGSFIQPMEENKPNNKYNYILHRTFKTRSFQTTMTEAPKANKPGSRAFVECETNAIQDLFLQFAQDDDNGGVDEEGSYLSLRGVRELLHNIGENPDEKTLKRLFKEADQNGDGKLDLEVSFT